MKEAVGGISIFQIVIFFILVFTGIMCLTINHSKAFGVKDEIITILENSKLDVNAHNGIYGLSNATMEDIRNHFKDVGYHITGHCPTNDDSTKDNWIGYNINLEVDNNQPVFCIRANKVASLYAQEAAKKCEGNKCVVTEEDFPPAVYYDVVLFFQFDVPFLNNFLNFKLSGSTKVIFG